ncbi:MAG: hypothetical protein KDC54_12330 [Lewinella sp.]|nr:hypothetical protein [Lewinella sp.]
MNVFQRLSRGWHLGITSLEVIRDHPKLLLFPVMSGGALIIAMLSFAGGIFALFGINPQAMESFFAALEDANTGNVLGYLALFAFYLITYFVVIFFNVGLVYNAQKVFEGGEPSIREGMQHAANRVVNIFAWAALAATVGVILKSLEERLGLLGRIAISLVGFAWSIGTYFVVPVLAHENVTPVEAVKRSVSIIRERWGEALGAGFSFGLFQMIGIVLAIVGAVIVAQFNVIAGLAVGFLTFLLSMVVTSAARNVFLAAAYQHTQGNTPNEFDGQTLDGIFMPKR